MPKEEDEGYLLGYEPFDKKPGWKYWSYQQDRWWQGTQWSDTYRENVGDEAVY